jgi:uncharacterized membrane protein
MTTPDIAAPSARRLVQLIPGWRTHPWVGADDELSLGERAADKMRNGMGSWALVFGALVFLGLWMGVNRRSGFDKYPFILLNFVLSCLAALQGAILLIAAKRSDQIAAELAQHDELHRQFTALVERLETSRRWPAPTASL